MDIKKTRIKSLLGGAVFLCGSIVCWFNMKELTFFFIGLALLILGWFIFSHYHTQIAIFKLKQYTEEYVESLKK